MKDENRRNVGPSIICAVMMGMLVLGSTIMAVADQPPVADAEPNHQTVTAGEEAWFFGNNSYDPDGCIVSYCWDFGEGLRYTGETVTYTFNAPGNYTVTLTVIDDDNNEDSDIVTVTVLEDGPPSGEMTVWIDSLVTDKSEYDINEVVDTTVVVQRSDDWLTYVWEGTLVLVVLDGAMNPVHEDVREVYLPHGGASETHDFQFALSDDGDYLVRTTLYDLNNEQVDMEEITITVRGQSGGDLMVWIDSLETDKDEYEIDETVDTTVVVRRGDDLLDYVWEGTVVLEVFDEAMVSVNHDEREVTLPCGGTTETHNFRYALSEAGDYLVRATLYDSFKDMVDIEEEGITVIDQSGGNGTKPPNNQDGMVWIDSLATDKQNYDLDETVDATVVVKRGDDWLTYVWEGSLVLEVFDTDMNRVHEDARDVFLPHGGASETHGFQFALSDDGDYLVRATLYDPTHEPIDAEETGITVIDQSGGSGTVPPNEVYVPYPSDGNDVGRSTGDKSGIFQMESGMQMMSIVTASIAIAALSIFMVIRHRRGGKNSVKKS